MITEDYVSLETAKLLKEKGFDVRCEYCYAEFNKDDIEVIGLSPAKCAQSLKEDRYPYVTLQMAMKWLREVKAIHICVKPNEASANCKYFATVIANDTKWGNIQDDNRKTIMFETYEEACEAAVKYCLENLI